MKFSIIHSSFMLAPFRLRVISCYLLRGNNHVTEITRSIIKEREYFRYFLHYHSIDRSRVNLFTKIRLLSCLRSRKILFQCILFLEELACSTFFFFYITFSLSMAQSSMILQMLHGTWSQWSTLLLLLLGTRLLFVVAQCGSFAQDRQEKEDKQDKLALYKVTLRTYWSRARFPRHYPEWKPPAQFGKLIGESLNDI